VDPIAPHAAPLELVPECRRVPETFGLQPGIWGSALILSGILIAPWSLGPHAVAQIAIPAFLLTLGMALTGYEIRRRRNRTVLVKDDERFAIYRKGRLDRILVPGEIRTIEADFVSMLQIGIPLGLAGLLFTVLGIDVSVRDKSLREGGVILSFGVACWASLASAAWTRYACRHLRIPVRGKKWFEESVLVHRSRIRELFGGGFPGDMASQNGPEERR